MKSIYSMHPGLAMEVSSVAKIQESTGKSLQQWIDILKKSELSGDRERTEWLKKEHKLGTNYAGWIVGRANGTLGTENYKPDALVEAMFSGGKSALRPVYDHLVLLGLALGDDVKACPCKTIVPLYRKHVFAQIKPSTQTRIDLGFALKDRKATGRLLDTGGLAKGDRITHRIPISSIAEIDAEVHKLLRAAYNLDK